MATCSGGKPSLVQEQIFASWILSQDKIYFKKNGRSLEPCSDARSREMVIQFDFGRMDKTRLIALPKYQNTPPLARGGVFLLSAGSNTPAFGTPSYSKRGDARSDSLPRPPLRVRGGRRVQRWQAVLPSDSHPISHQLHLLFCKMLRFIATDVEETCQFGGIR